MSYEVPTSTDLRGRVAVVTGGSGVLCGTMARALASCGAKVAVLGRRLEAAQRVAGQIQSDGGEALGVSCNVLDHPGLEAARATIEARFGVVTILINGAGGNHPKGTTTREYLLPEDLKAKPEDVTTFFDLDLASIQFVFNLNFLGTLLPTQVFARGMAERGAGDIINISSMAALKPLTKIPAYSAAKASVSNFTQWLAVHFSRVGVRVNAIAPGFFLTDQNRTLLTNPDGSLTPRGQTIQAHTPQRKFGSPDDLVGPLLWLLNNRASGFVTGQIIPVDGGFSAFAGV